MASPAGTFPPAALDWLAAPAAVDVAAIGIAAFTLTRRFATTPRLTVIDRDPTRVADAADRVPGTVAIAAAPDAIPFVPCAFDQVVVADLLHTLPPRRALAEFARVLRPSGNLAVVHTARDDSVPWVRRLAGIVRRIDPAAMAESAIAATAAALHDNPYFPHLERREFRRWVPAAKADLLAMVEQLPGFASAAADLRADVLAATNALYGTVARVPDPLLLPYTITCWCGPVDHTELTAPLEMDDTCLQITL